MAYNDKQIGKNKNFLTALRHSLDGLRCIILEERNMRKHLLTALIVCAVGFFFQLRRQEWLWLILVIFIVFLSEVVNTITENIVDLIVGPHYNERAKKIKDMAAGMVLLASLLAVIVGLIIFLPKLGVRLRGL